MDTNFNFNEFTGGAVNALGITSSGEIVAGGSFARSNNQRTLIRLTPSGAFDPAFNAGITGTVDRIAIDSSNRVLTVGAFLNVNGSDQDRFARFNPDGTHDSSGLQSSSFPRAPMALPDGGVLLSGTFFNPTRQLTRLSSSLVDDGSFSSNSPNSIVEGFLLQPDRKVIAFGWFWMFGSTPAGRVLRLNADMTLDTTFNATVDNGIVDRAVLQGDGRIVIAGSFLSIGGVPTSRIARLNSDGTLDTSFQADVASRPTAIAIDSDQRIYLSGAFSAVNGSLRDRFARFHANGDLDTGFDPGAGPGSPINAIAIAADGNVVIGGAFTAFDGVPRMRIAKVFGGPSVPEAPAITVQPTNVSVLAGSSPRLAVRATGGPRLYYQWRFNGLALPGETHQTLTLTNIMLANAGGYSVVVSNELGVVQSDTASIEVLTFPPGFTAQPTNVARLVGQNASFITVLTGAPPPVLRWYHNSNLVTAASSATLSLSNVSLSQAGDYFLVASNFVGVATSAVAHLSVTLATNLGAVDPGFRPPPLGGVAVRAAALQPDGKLLVARDTAVYRLNQDGSLDPGFANLQLLNSGGIFPSGGIEALAVQPDGKVVVGGTFSIPYPGLVRLETNGLIDPTFTPVSGPRRVQGIVVQADGRIIYGSGTPTSPTFPTTPFPVLTRLFPNGGIDPLFNTLWGPAGIIPPPAPITNIYGMEPLQNGKTLLDSSFGFFRLLRNGEVDISFDGSHAPNLVDPPRVMALQNDGKILIGGVRRGTNSACLFRLNADGTLDPTFSPGATGTGITAIVVVPDGKIVIAGAFTNVQGEVRNGVARLNKDGTLDPTFDVAIGPTGVFNSTNLQVRKILLGPDGQLIVAGAFTQFNNYDRPGVVRLLTDAAGPPRIITPPLSQSVHAGQFVRLFAEVAAMPPAAVQWKFNDVPLEGATNLTLRIDEVEAANAGSYTLTLSNAFGAVTSAPVTLTVSAAIQPGMVDAAFDPAVPNGTVLAALRQPDGKIIIGGTFTEISGVPRNRIARLHSDGTLDLTFPAGIGVTNNLFFPVPAVRALDLERDGRIIIAGTLGYVDGQPRPRIARLNPDGSLDSSFPDRLSGTDAYSLLRLRDGKLVVGTSSSAAVTRLHADGTLDLSFFGQGGVFSDSRPEALAELPDGKLLVANSLTNSRLAGLMRLQINGIRDDTFTAVRSPVRSFVLLEDSILIGGTFTNIHGVARRHLAALTPDGALLTNAWSSVILSHPVRRLTRDACGRVLVAGSFSNVNGQRHAGIARFFEDGTLDASFAPQFDGEIHALLPESDFRFFVGGEFTEISSTLRRGAARILEDIPTPPLLLSQPTNQTIRAGTELSLISGAADCAGRQSFQWQHNGVNIPNATNSILHFPNAKTDLRGEFRLIISNLAGAVTSAVATVSVSPPTTMPGDNDIEFFPQYTPTGGVRTIALQADGKLLVSGKYPDGDVMKRFNPDGSLDEGFDLTWLNQSINKPLPVVIVPESNGTTLVGFTTIGLFRLDSQGERIGINWVTTGSPVRALAVRPDGTIVLGGDFSHVLDLRSPGLALISKLGVVDTNFGNVLPTNMRVAAMALTSEGNIIVARSFLFQATNAISRFLPTGVLDDTFAESSVSNSITALALQSDGRILVAGNFTNFNGVARPHLVRLNTNGSLDSSFISALQPGNTIHAIAVQPDDKIIICGTTGAGAPLANRGVLRLHRNGALDSTFDPGAGANGSVTALALSPSGSVYLAGQFDSYDGFARPSLARAHGNPRSQGPALANNTFTISLYTDLDRTYYLETNAVADGRPRWATVDFVHGSGDVQTLRDVNPEGTARFYRVRVE